MSAAVTEAMSLALPADSKLMPYRILGEESEMRLQIIQDNVGDGQFRLFDLRKVKVPSAGTTFWQIPTVTGKPEVSETIEGVVIAIHFPAKAYHIKSIDEREEGDPAQPDCMSYDGKRGFGLPVVWNKADTSTTRIWRDCDGCMHNEWGTAKKGGRGKACGDRTILFIIREKDVVPLTIWVPGGSANAWRNYRNALTNEGLGYYSIITSIGLKGVPAKPGIPAHNEMTFTCKQELGVAEVRQVMAVRQRLEPAIQKLISDAAKGQLTRPTDDEDAAYEAEFGDAEEMGESAEDTDGFSAEDDGYLED